LYCRSIANTCKDKFIPYYSAFVPGIKSIMVSSTHENGKELRGKAMECIGLICEGVGIDVFSNDAMEILQILIQSMVHTLLLLMNC
jgi:hypothetical protein